MEYSITFRDEDYARLLSHLFSDRLLERAAYLLCNYSVTDLETRLLITEVIPVTSSDVSESSVTHMSIGSSSYVKAIKRSRETKQGLVFVHSHPPGIPNHSSQDDSEELKFFNTVYSRNPDVPAHASMVVSDPETPVARVWMNDLSTAPVSVVRTIGQRFHFYADHEGNETFPHFFDRQIRAFGPEVQKVLGKMKIGIVGLGGTGSAVAEQLIRLGVGTLYIFDPGKFELTNINRVYGSRTSDDGRYKTEIIQRMAEEIGLGTTIRAASSSITKKTTAEQLKNCDVIFGCTDDHWGRSILCKLPIYYYIPVFDVGVKIDSEESEIRSIHGRCTTLLPNEACLLCRGLDEKMITSEVMEATNPAEAQQRRREGYVSELPGVAPAVIPLTSTVASTSVIEFLHRLTGLLGSDRKTNEIIHLFDKSEIKRNSRQSRTDCECANNQLFGKGDLDPFLGITWQNET